MSNEDDREMRTKSNDNRRYAGNKKTPAPLHSKQANPRMGGGDTDVGMADEGITLAGLVGDGSDAEVSKQGDDDGDDATLPASNDVDEIARDLLELDDEDTARAIARVIVRTGDVVGDLAASMEDDGVRMNDRIGSI